MWKKSSIIISPRSQKHLLKNIIVVKIGLLNGGILGVRVRECHRERQRERKGEPLQVCLLLPDCSGLYYRVSTEPSHRERREKSCIVPKLGTKINRVCVEGVLPPPMYFFLGLCHI